MQACGTLRSHLPTYFSLLLVFIFVLRCEQLVSVSCALQRKVVRMSVIPTTTTVRQLIELAHPNTRVHPHLRSAAASASAVAASSSACSDESDSECEFGVFRDPWFSGDASYQPTRAPHDWLELTDPNALLSDLGVRNGEHLVHRPRRLRVLRDQHLPTHTFPAHEPASEFVEVSLLFGCC
jgi:hypothetical protein